MKEDPESKMSAKHRISMRHEQAMHEISEIRSRMGSKKGLVVIMVMLSACDVILNMSNLVFYTSGPLDVGLLIGPIPFAIWLCIIIFTSISILFFLLETLNTVSVLYTRDEMPLLALHNELLITLPLEHIPLAVVNYLISVCHQNSVTFLQFCCGGFSMIFVFTRLLYHAHFHGKLLKLDDKRALQMPRVLLVCVLYSLAITFSVQSWTQGKAVSLKPKHLNGISIFLVNSTSISDAAFENFPVHDLYPSVPSWRSSRVARNLRKVYDARQNGTIATFPCSSGKTAYKYAPVACLVRTKAPCYVGLRFKFKFIKKTSDNPFGSIHYNYATVPAERSPSSCRLPVCVPATDDLESGWRLRYMVVESPRWRNRTVRSPPNWGCITPRPAYDPNINPCLD